MARWRSVAWATLLLVTMLPAEGIASPVTVEVDAHGAEHECPVEEAPASCPARWAQNGTVAPGDDEVSAKVFVNDVRLTARPPGNGSSESFEIEPSNLTVQHPVNRELNRTWLALNGSRPVGTDSTLAFESRPQRSYSEDGGYTEEEWGLFLVVYHPLPVKPLSPVAWCWDICTLDNQSYMKGTEGELIPFPNGVLLSGEEPHKDLSTDSLVAWRFYEVQNCAEVATFVEQFTCDTAAIMPALQEAHGTYRNATPQVASGLQVNRTTVAVEPNETMPDRSTSYQGNISLRSRGAPELPLSKRPSRAGEPLANPAAVPGGPLPGEGAPRLPPEPESPQGPPTSVLTTGSARGSLILLAAGAGVSLLLGTVAWLLYHRIGRREGLGQETRQRIHNAIVQRPGLRASEMAALLKLNHNTVKHHLDRLVAWNLVRASERIRPRYFPTGQSEAEAEVSAALARPTVRAVHTALMEHGELDHSRLAALVEVSLPTVGRAVAELVAVGLATQTKKGRRALVRHHAQG